MNNVVPADVVKKTTRCPSQFACLAGGKNRPKCDIESANGENVLFIKKENKTTRDCPYRIPFGHSQLCTCPVHYTIYRQ